MEPQVPKSAHLTHARTAAAAHSGSLLAFAGDPLAALLPSHPRAWGWLGRESASERHKLRQGGVDAQLRPFPARLRRAPPLSHPTPPLLSARLGCLRQDLLGAAEVRGRRRGARALVSLSPPPPAPTEPSRLRRAPRHVRSHSRVFTPRAIPGNPRRRGSGGGSNKAKATQRPGVGGGGGGQEKQRSAPPPRPFLSLPSLAPLSLLCAPTAEAGGEDKRQRREDSDSDSEPASAAQFLS